MANAIVEVNGGKMNNYIKEDGKSDENIMERALETVKRKEDRRRFDRRPNRRFNDRNQNNRFNREQPNKVNEQPKKEVVAKKEVKEAKKEEKPKGIATFDEITFEDFSKIELRVGKILDCEPVKKSKKLLQFTLDDGTGEDRTILSGIHAYYEPEELVGKTLIAITNLPPRAMMGIDSCGMLLSAIHEEEGEEKLHLLMVDNHIPAGAKLY